MGRKTDHLQGIFRVSYDLLQEMDKDVEWVSYDHPLHGYIFPFRVDDGSYEVDEVQIKAVEKVIDYLDAHLKTGAAIDDDGVASRRRPETHMTRDALDVRRAS